MINATGLQTNAIVISIRAEQVEEFEALFAAEELPIWDALHGARQGRAVQRLPGEGARVPALVAVRVGRHHPARPTRDRRGSR